MTETRFTWRWLLVIALVGIIMGLAVGLATGWILFPNIGGSNVAGLSALAQNDYIVLVANTYAYDQDLAKAKERLRQLQEKDLKTRVERLAKTLSARKDPSAANVADLAVALGSESSEVQELALVAANDGWGADSEPIEAVEPTKVARSDSNSNVSVEKTATAPAQPTGDKQRPARQTKTAAAAAQATASAAPTTEPEATQEPEPTQAAPKPTALPKSTDVPATPVPAAAPRPNTQWLPPLESDWPTTAFFRPADVAPGQEYWRLVKALYCDAASDGSQDGDGRNGCPEMPGGPLGVGTYVMLLNPDGSRAEAQLNVRFENGTGDKIGPDIISPKDAGDQCNCNYSWESSNYLVQVEGASDAVGGLCLCSRYKNFGSRSHVRYFFWFQKTIR